MSDTCLAPEFVWVAERGVWTACVECGRLAWDHEQADPLADLQAAMAGRAGADSPPTMRPAGR